MQQQGAPSENERVGENLLMDEFDTSNYSENAYLTSS